MTFQKKPLKVGPEVVQKWTRSSPTSNLNVSRLDQKWSRVDQKWSRVKHKMIKVGPEVVQGGPEVVQG